MEARDGILQSLRWFVTTLRSYHTCRLPSTCAFTVIIIIITIVIVIVRGEWHCMTARSCGARAGVKRIYMRMPDSRTKASTCFAAAVICRISGVGKIYTKVFDCVFQTSPRLCEFDTNFKNMFCSFWYFTLVAEPVMKTST